MNRTFFGVVSMCVAALALASCAASGSSTADGQTATLYTKGKKLANGYLLVKKNGQDYYCRTESVTGSRSRVVETCLTEAQLKQQQANAQALVEGIQRAPGTMPGTDSQGGMSNSAVSQ